MSSLPVTDPVLIFSIVLISVLVAPLLAEKLRLPGIIGLIVFGIVLGPHVSKVLEKDQAIELLGKIGLLHIMFLAGLEINLEEVKKSKHHSVLFGLLTFFIPLLLGTLAGLYILNLNLLASILLASMFSSHTLLTFPIVSKLGLTKKPSVTATIGGTIITDTMAMIVLAVIIAMQGGEVGPIFWVKLSVFSLLYVAVVVILLPKLTFWFFKNFFSDSGAEDYVFVITALFVSAYFSHLVGLEPIIGAFLAGLTLNPLIPEKSVLMNRIKFVADSLFIPFFLLSVGMLIDPLLVFTDKESIIVAVTMIAAALSSKFFAAIIFGKLTKFSRYDIGLIFGLSVNQAAATLAAVLVGYDVGIFKEPVLAGTVMMIIVTSFLGSILTQRFSIKIVKHDEANQDSVKKGDVERILVPLSNPNNINSLMDLAFLLQPKASQEPIYPLHIALENENVEQNVIFGENVLTKAGARANAVQKRVLPLNKIDSNVLSAILKTVNEQRISKIIMGVSPRGKFASSFFNNVSEQLIKYCDKMVFISKYEKPFSLMNRVILIVPPYIYKQNGFLNTVNSLKKLGSELSVEWFIVSEEDTFQEIKTLFTSQKAEPKHHYVRSWKNIEKELTPIVKGSDLIIPLLARRGHLSWRLHFEQMPAMLYKSFEENNVLVVYPLYSQDEKFESAVEVSETLIEDLRLLELVPPENFFFNSADSNFVSVFKSLLEKVRFGFTHEIVQEIVEVTNDFPIELSKDIVLIHTRTDLVQEYNLFVVINREGFLIEKIENPHRLVIILLSPKSQSTQSHLNMLSQISRMVLMERYVESVIEADNYSDFRKRLE
ncbi:MAG: cation:proton antiporter [Spirochaetales bacterium]|nr:cation:proton antiporter [Spirochaetales bacterium]